MVKKIERKVIDKNKKLIGSNNNRSEKWKNVRGEVSTSFIVGVILVLMGLAILLFFYYQLAWTGEVNREVCHQSVIYRATLPSIAKGYVPLKCPTQKICLTGKILGKGECEEFKNEENYITTVRVSNSEKGLNEIQKVYAEEILNCWSMMGEGKVSLYSEGTGTYLGFGEVYPSCVICSRIAIDEASLDEVNFLNMGLENYMLTHAAPGSEKSYFDIMLGEGYSGLDVLTAGEIKVQTIGENERGENVEIREEDGTIEDLVHVIDSNELKKETAVVFSQISSPSFSGTFLKDAGVLAGGAYLAPRLAFKAVTSVPGLVVLGVFAIAQTGSITYNKAVTAGYCGEFDTSSESRDGCSAVRTLDYNPKTILKHCGVIESLP